MFGLLFHGIDHGDRELICGRSPTKVRLFLSPSTETANLVPDAIPRHYGDLVHSPHLTVSIWNSFPITCQIADSQP